MNIKKIIFYLHSSIFILIPRNITNIGTNIYYLHSSIFILIRYKEMEKFAKQDSIYILVYLY